MGMIKIDRWPPPIDWTEVVLLWEDILDRKIYRDFTSWLEETHGGRYHIHGYESTLGFAVRFEKPEDAILFKLKWA